MSSEVSASTAGAISAFGGVAMSKETINKNIAEFNNIADTVDSQSKMLLAEAVASVKDLAFGDTAMTIKGLRLNLNSTFDTGAIQSMTSAERLSSATGRMANYIMANEGLGQLFNAEKINGYDDGFNDDRLFGEDLLEFRVAINGMLRKRVVKDSDKEASNYIATNYTEDLPNDFDKLSINDQFKVMETWDTIDAILAEKDLVDFTMNRPVIDEYAYDVNSGNVTEDEFDIMKLIG